MKIQVDNNIQIELLVPKHAQSLFELTEQNRQHLKQWLAWLDLVKTYEDTEIFIETAVHQHNHNQGSSFAVLYCGELVGVAGFNHYDFQHKWGAIGYWLSASCAGKGIMTKVVNALLAYGFYENRLNKIEIRCGQQNFKSRAIPERLGFTNEATLRQCEWLYDHYIDHVVYSLLASEYQANKPHHHS